MIGFFIGMLVGATLLGDGASTGALNNAIGQIPLRCLKAHEMGWQTYWDCRAPGIFGELVRSTQRRGDMSSDCFSSSTRWTGTGGRHCDVNFHVKLEFDALTDLRAALEAKKAETAK